MKIWQEIVVLTYGLINLVVFSFSFYKTKFKKQANKLTPGLSLLGIFAWGDGVVFGPFWLLSSLISYFLNDWLLFLLIISVFWLVRSLGETIYWFNQQFSTINRNPPERLFGYSIFQNDSIWWVHQIIHQCTTIITIITTVFLFNLWLKSF